jgi:hypothetical protein
VCVCAFGNSGIACSSASAVVCCRWSTALPPPSCQLYSLCLHDCVCQRAHSVGTRARMCVCVFRGYVCGCLIYVRPVPCSSSPSMTPTFVLGDPRHSSGTVGPLYSSVTAPCPPLCPSIPTVYLIEVRCVYQHDLLSLMCVGALCARRARCSKWSLVANIVGRRVALPLRHTTQTMGCVLVHRIASLRVSLAHRSVVNPLILHSASAYVQHACTRSRLLTHTTHILAHHTLARPFGGRVCALRDGKLSDARVRAAINQQLIESGEKERYAPRCLTSA